MGSEDKVDSGLAAEKSMEPRKSDGGDGSIDLEATKKHIPYPKSVIFIVVCEFCERFNYYGMRAILTLYFKNILGWDEDFATVIYHLFTMFCYFTPLLGAMLADSLLGKFRTIFYLAVVYACGSIVLTLAATPPLSIPTVPFSMIGLALIAVGTGGIKPCVAAFGGDQFTIPGQETQLASYFAVFYFAINAGSLISTTVTPIFREDVSCFDDDTCYPLAFFVPAALMCVALVIFLVGRPFYTIHKPEGNIVLKVLGAIKHSLSRKSSEVKAGRVREHWMDYGDDKYDKVFLEDTKAVLKVLFLYLPLPLFWALFDQQGSRWTFQATRMDGDLGGYLVKPDQMQVINPLMVLAFIPIFDRVIYPLLSKCGILRKPLQRLAMGGVFAGIAFAVSGIVELELEKTYALELKGNEASVHFVNTLPCSVDVAIADTNHAGTIAQNDMLLMKTIEANIGEDEYYALTINGECVTAPLAPLQVKAEKGKALTYVIHQNANAGNAVTLYKSFYHDELEKSEEGDPIVRFIFTDDYESGRKYKVILRKHGKDNDDKYTLDETFDSTGSTDSKHMEVDPYDEYVINLIIKPNDEAADEIDVEISGMCKLNLGGNYVITIAKTGAGDEAKDFVGKTYTITEPNSLHMAWLLPQYLIMTMGEIMFSITIMDFSYAEAPMSMKSVMQSAWLMTVAFGNLIVVIIAEAKIFDKQWKEFFLFAGLMFGDMVLFSYMAYIYVPNQKLAKDEPEEKAAIEEKKGGNENEAYED